MIEKLSNNTHSIKVYHNTSTSIAVYLYRLTTNKKGRRKKKFIMYKRFNEEDNMWDNDNHKASCDKILRRLTMLGAFE
jgi:hypothetical protein